MIYSGGVGTLEDLERLRGRGGAERRGRDRRPGALRGPLQRRRRRSPRSPRASPGVVAHAHYAWPMALKRVIPCLDVDAGRVVKGTNFVGLRDAGDPVELAERYDAEGADELVFLDITASHEAPRDDRRARPPDRRQRLHPVHDRRRDPLGRGRPGGARRRRRQGLGQLGGAGAAGAARRAGRPVRRPVRGDRDRRQGRGRRQLGRLRQGRARAGRRAATRSPGPKRRSSSAPARCC